MTPEELNALDDLAGEYVVGTLPWAQRQAVQARLRHEPVLAAKVAEWEARLQPLADTVAPLAPSKQLWPRIRRSTSTIGAEGWRRWWNDVRFWRTSALAVSFATLVLAVVLGVQLRTPAPVPQFVVVLMSPQDKTPAWLVQVGANRKLRLIPLKSQEVQPAKALQFWTKADGWSAPMSLGLVQAGESLEISLDRLPPMQPNQLFEITLEPPNGSLIGRPTGPILSIGRAVPTT
ncbi:anti-sigma factor [Pandoraea sp. PE-S2T-3]|uniref:anti-sigma factor n=1 Tax=Pandoraea sp. PE-S2T-3 TaxID=1986993 RepID=UPI000B4006E3|nr:anti-sigma factor [Pandoraea sp. PE-S2T-3]